jgi:hypothetical protein
VPIIDGVQHSVIDAAESAGDLLFVSVWGVPMLIISVRPPAAGSAGC